jgi:peptidoglycan/xylan/chitin deacetylase (PgdA/CDA1 family)
MRAPRRVHPPGRVGMSDVLALCYHAVSETWPAALSVTPERLRGQLALLLDRGYAPVTFSRAVLDPPPGRCVAVTFDDAYLSVHTLARPILAELGVVATVFAPTDFVARPEPMRWPGIERWLGTVHEPELRPMSWAQLAALVAGGWEVGSHTARHPRLTELGDLALDSELAASRAECERRLGTACTAIAYPFGDVDPRVRRAAGRAGYVAGAGLSSTWYRPRELEFPRVGVYFGDHRLRYRLKVSPLVRLLRLERGRRSG